MRAVPAAGGSRCRLIQTSYNKRDRMCGTMGKSRAFMWILVLAFCAAAVCCAGAEAEKPLTLMVYMAVLSATLAIRKRSHIRMTAFDQYLPKKALICLDLLADLAVLILGIILVKYGYEVIKPTGNIAKFAKYSSLPKLSQIWMYLPVPIAGLGMIIFELEQVFQHLEEFFVPNKDGKEAKA